MAEESAIYCPLCGNKVPPGVTKCLVCATELQKVIARRSADKAEAPKSLTDYLRKELPKTELPVAKVTCPQCAVELHGGEAKCPRCGIPLKSEQDMLECPECGALTPEDAKACPNCGVGFEDQGEEEIEVPAPPPPVEVGPPELLEPVILPQAPTELKPEVVTTMPAGVSTTSGQGLVNGRGAVNGTGLINGTGLVNGTGMTNGTKIEGRMTPAMGRRGSFLTRWQFLAVVVALVIVIPTFVYLSYSAPSEGTTIDGNFGDWSHANKLGIFSVAGSAPVDIDEWSIQVKDQQLFLYFRVQGVLMGSTNVDSFYLFVDSDNSPSTGYAVSGIGADYLLELSGWNGSVQSTSLDRYESTTDDQFDWNSWVKLNSFSASSGTNELEAMAEMPVALNGNAKFVLMSQDYLSRNSVSYAVPTVGGVLVVEQFMGTGVQTDGIVAQASGVLMLRLVFTCQGGGGTVQNVAPSVSGAEFASSFEEFRLSAGQEHIVDLQFNTLASAVGSLVSVSVVPGGVTSTFPSVQVFGFPVRAYVASAPADIYVDGAFGDWTGKTRNDTDSTSVGNANININSVGVVNTTSSSSFYVSVVGDMCSGSYVPFIVSKPSGSGGGGGIVIHQRKTGEDILRVYIDSDMSAATGYPVSLSSKTIGADFKIEVTGVYGEITSTSLTNYSGGAWDSVSGALVSAANDVQRMELQISSASISNSVSIDYVIETTDWKGRSDLATSVPQGTRAWIIDGTTTSAAATAMSYQRKLFYDGTNFWSFYWDGTDTVYKHSTDSGVTWTAGGAVFKAPGVNEASIWWDAANSAVYVVGDTSTATVNVRLQKGIVTPATSSINWAGSDRNLAVSSNVLAGKNAFISRDASGYIWVMSSNCTSATPTRYDLSAFRSSATNSITSWLFGGNMLDTDDNEFNLKGSVLPAGTGTDVWAVYGYGGNVAARKLTSGVWSAQTTIYPIGSANRANTDNAPPCGVVDANGVVHVVYGDGHEQTGVSKPYIYYVDNAGSGWSVPHRLESVGNTLGNVYPTISVDSSTGNVYAFWIETDTNGVGVAVMGKKNVPPYLDTTWTVLTLPGQTAGAKQHLNSIYSGPAESTICWQWTQNTTSPIEVLFDKLPEFKSVVLPVVFLTLMVVVGMQRRRGRSRRDE